MPRALLPGPSLRRQNRRPNVVRSEHCDLASIPMLAVPNERTAVAKPFGVTCNFRPQYGNLWQTCPLLRPRRERPRCRAAEQRDEFAASHDRCLRTQRDVLDMNYGASQENVFSSMYVQAYQLVRAGSPMSKNRGGGGM